MHEEEEADHLVFSFGDPDTVFLGIVVLVKFVEAFPYIGLEPDAIVIFVSVEFAVPMHDIAEIAGSDICPDGYFV
jgi:hypothetical protein